NILEKVRKCDYAEVKADAQAIYLAEDRKQAQAPFRGFRARWQKAYSSMVHQLSTDLPELLSFFSFPRHLRRNLRTTNIIERLLCGSAASYPAHGLLCKYTEHGSNHLFHLPEV